MSHLFIADLHLNDQEPLVYERFKDFVNNKARNARALYILGDLFEYYLGDDAIAGVIENVCNDISELVDKFKVDCYFMAGNRDFLLANGFAAQSSITILNDPTCIQLDEKKVILTHADALCTDDVEYQKVRLQLRDPHWQQWFLNLSIPERIEFAKQARTQSQKHTQASDDQIMDVNHDAVKELFKAFNTNFMLHGHTHRPCFHRHFIDNLAHHRMVLGDWHYQTSYIEYKNNNFQLLTC
ncbi:MAG: UDP-2,3-diacylglucosamine diphosphatase [Marinicellaceae bacterium]